MTPGPARVYPGTIMLLPSLGERMRVAVGETTAICGKCRGEQFAPLAGSGHHLRDKRFSCAGCGAQYEYAELLLNISEQVVAATKTARGAGS